MQAAAAASIDELRAKAAAVLHQFNLDPDDPKVATVAAAGAMFVNVVAQWAIASGLPATTAQAIEGACGVAVETLLGLAQQ